LRLRPLTFFLYAGLALAASATNNPRFTYAFPSTGLGSQGLVIAADANGNTYFAGTVSGNAFTATPGAYQTQPGGGTCYGGGGGGFGILLPGPCASTFVVKLNPLGVPVFATYLGGASDTRPTAIAFDSQGNVYVAGTGEFPVTASAAFPNPASGFIAKFNAAGTQLEYATYIAASVSGLAVDTAGNLYFAGWDIEGVPFPTTPGAYQPSPGNPIENAIVGKLNAAGSTLLYGTYLSGTQGFSNAAGIALDAAGNVLIDGETNASDFPATEGQFIRGTSADDIFLAKFNAATGALIYSSLLGPGSPSPLSLAPEGDVIFGIGADAANYPSAAVPFGGTAPTTGGAGYLLHVSPDGSTVLSLMYLPFTLTAVAVDSAGNADILGNGLVSTTTGAFQSSEPSGSPFMVAKVAPDGQVAGATYMSGLNGGYLIAAEPDGSVVVAGGMDNFAAINFFPALTIQNAASFAANFAAPGELVAIQGYGLGPAGVQVYFDSFAAPILYAQANQVNVQVPWEIAGQSSTKLQVSYNGAAVAGVNVPVEAALPGIFFIENSDGSINSPANPARPGDFVAIYGTGGGALNPPGSTGGTWPLSPLSYLAQSASATVGSETAQVLYAGSAPTLDTWFFQMNVLLPPDLTAATNSLSVTIGGISSAPASVAIQ